MASQVQHVGWERVLVDCASKSLSTAAEATHNHTLDIVVYGAERHFGEHPVGIWKLYLR